MPRRSGSNQPRTWYAHPMTELTKESLAAMIHGCEYREELGRFDGRAAKAAGLVVVFGASDDLMELEGAIHEEFDCFSGGIAYLDVQGLIDRERSGIDDGATDRQIEEYSWRKTRARSIRAVWGKDDISWQYETTIPHATFDVMEDGEVYCRGIVFALADLVPRVVIGQAAWCGPGDVAVLVKPSPG
jgi:hypothetical protein